MSELLLSGFLAAIITIFFNCVLNYQRLKRSLREILSDLRHEKLWQGVWSTDGMIDGPIPEENAELYLWSKGGIVNGYFRKFEGMIYPLLFANSGFRKKTKFEGFSYVGGIKVVYGIGELELISENEMRIIDDHGRNLCLIKHSDNPDEP